MVSKSNASVSDPELHWRLIVNVSVKRKTKMFASRNFYVKWILHPLIILITFDNIVLDFAFSRKDEVGNYAISLNVKWSTSYITHLQTNDIYL